MKKYLIVLAFSLVVVSVLTIACGTKTGSSGNTGGNTNAVAGKVVKTVPVGNLTATLSSSTGQIKQGEQEITLSFTDASGKPVEVGAASLNFFMPQMGSMAAMTDAVTLTTTGTPGVYSGKVNVEGAGEWQGQLAYEGAAGKGKTVFSVTAQ